jgi:hypothetical protein
VVNECYFAYSKSLVAAEQKRGHSETAAEKVVLDSDSDGMDDAYEKGQAASFVINEKRGVIQSRKKGKYGK